jgi:hypothetical protein
VFSANIIKLSASLISSAFVDYVENRLPINIEDVDDYKVIKVNVVF